MTKLKYNPKGMHIIEMYKMNGSSEEVADKMKKRVVKSNLTSAPRRSHLAR